MKVYAPEDKSWVPAIEAPVSKDEEIDVDPEIGESLVEQGWTSARQKAAKKVGRARKRANASDDEPDPIVEPETVDPNEQFATGGPVSGGNFQVGESGPEVFNPPSEQE